MIALKYLQLSDKDRSRNAFKRMKRDMSDRKTEVIREHQLIQKLSVFLE